MDASGAVDPELEARYAEYRSAYRLGTAAGADEQAAEALLRARVALFEELARTGWDAPELVKQQIGVDRLLLAVRHEELEVVDRLVDLDARRVQAVRT
jgi:hypothetical protein